MWTEFLEVRNAWNFEKKRGHASERGRERRKNGDKNRLKRLGSDSS